MGGGGKAGPNPLFSKEEGERHHPMLPVREWNRPGKWLQGESGPCPQRPHWRNKASLDDEDFRDWKNFSLSRWKADRALILDHHLGAFAVNLANECRNRTNAMCDRSPPPLADLLSPKAKPTAAPREGHAEMRARAVGKGRVETPPLRPIEFIN